MASDERTFSAPGAGQAPRAEKDHVVGGTEDRISGTLTTMEEGTRSDISSSTSKNGGERVEADDLKAALQREVERLQALRGGTRGEPAVVSTPQYQ